MRNSRCTGAKYTIRSGMARERTDSPLPACVKHANTLNSPSVQRSPSTFVPSASEQILYLLGYCPVDPLPLHSSFIEEVLPCRAQNAALPNALPCGSLSRSVGPPEQLLGKPAQNPATSARVGFTSTSEKM